MLDCIRNSKAIKRVSACKYNVLEINKTIEECKCNLQSVSVLIQPFPITPRIRNSKTSESVSVIKTEIKFQNDLRVLAAQKSHRKIAVTTVAASGLATIPLQKSQGFSLHRQQKKSLSPAIFGVSNPQHRRKLAMTTATSLRNGAISRRSDHGTAQNVCIIYLHPAVTLAPGRVRKVSRKSSPGRDSQSPERVRPGVSKESRSLCNDNKISRQ